MADEKAQEDVVLKPFAAFLQEHRGGSLQGELTKKLAELSRQVMDLEKGGTLTLTLKLDTSKLDGALMIVDDVKVKLPEPPRAGALWFPDRHGSLSRRDPRQPEIPGMRAVPSPHDERGEETG